MANLNIVKAEISLCWQRSICYGFSSSHVGVWELDHKEGWGPKNWCFQIVVLKKSLKSPMESKEIKAVNPKGNQPWIFIGRTDAEAEAPILDHWCKESIHWNPGSWGKLMARAEGDRRGWDILMASLTQWTWVWTYSRW